MHWYQSELILRPYPRGYHLITRDVIAAIPQINQINIGLLNIFIKHTSASLTINENTDPAVQRDFEVFFNKLVPEESAHYEHTYEGADDLPAHFKSSILGSSLVVPISDGALNLGTWQGIYLCEHRNRGGSRCLVLTLSGK